MAKLERPVEIVYSPATHGYERLGTRFGRFSSEKTVPTTHFTGVDLGAVTCQGSNPDQWTRSQWLYETIWWQKSCSGRLASIVDTDRLKMRLKLRSNTVSTARCCISPNAMSGFITRYAGKNFKVGGRALFQCIFPEFAMVRDWRKPWVFWVRILGTPTKFRTRYIINKSLQRCN
jgi:hypothetical protein